MENMCVLRAAEEHPHFWSTPVPQGLLFLLSFHGMGGDAPGLGGARLSLHTRAEPLSPRSDCKCVRPNPKDLPASPGKSGDHPELAKHCHTPEEPLSSCWEALMKM